MFANSNFWVILGLVFIEFSCFYVCLIILDWVPGLVYIEDTLDSAMFLWRILGFCFPGTQTLLNFCSESAADILLSSILALIELLGVCPTHA